MTSTASKLGASADYDLFGNAIAALIMQIEASLIALTILKRRRN